MNNTKKSGGCVILLIFMIIIGILFKLVEFFKKNIPLAVVFIGLIIIAIIYLLSKRKNKIPNPENNFTTKAKDNASSENKMDVHLIEAGRFIIEKQKASISMLQRMFKIGFNRAAMIMDQLAITGVVSGEEGAGPRKILMTIEEFEYALDSDFFERKLRHGITPASGERIRARDDSFDTMSGLDFEHYCANLLVENGFKYVEVTKASGDQGADIFAEKDGITYAIQCKLYQDNVGNKAIQEIYTAKKIFNKDIAVVMTNSFFTTSAQEAAAASNVKLWDGKVMDEMSN